MPLHPTVYAELLANKIRKHNAAVWLLNTGWTGGAHGVGHRIKLAHTRQMLSEALEGNLDKATFNIDPVFGLAIPQAVAGVLDQILMRRKTLNDEGNYDRKAVMLAKMFAENFTQFEDVAGEELNKAGPKIKI